MGVAIFIAAEREIEGVDIFVNGKALGKANEKSLSKVCSAAGLKSLHDYVSQDPLELREMLEEFGGDVPDELPDEQWYDASEGVTWARQLSAHLQANPKSIKDSALLLEDLAEYLGVFETLQSHGVRWHFDVDF